MTTLRETRTFDVSVKRDKVICDPMDLHVDRDKLEVLPVGLTNNTAREYDLMPLDFEKNPRNAFSQQQFNSSMIFIIDDNRRDGEKAEEGKFSIRVKKRDGGEELFLDPIVVND